MNLGTVFKLSLYGMTGLVGAILGAAEGEGTVGSPVRNELVLPFLSLPIVVCGYLLTEQRWFGPNSTGLGLSSLWANLLGLVALIATAWEFMSENREGKLLAGTHLLLYATWIVLFQQKTVRLYWFLMALGILQLAVASVLTTKGWFGFCGVVYVFGAVWTLSIFSLWRAEQSFEEAEASLSSEPQVRSNTALTFLAINSRQISEVRSSVQHEDGTRWLTVRFVTGVLMTTCSALAVSAAFFMFIPRMWVGAEVNLQDEGDGKRGIQRKTGLATTVKLGDLGAVLESTEPVFEIRLTNLKTGRTILAQDYAEQLGMAEPLFRGAVLTNYVRGQWKADLPAHSNIHNRQFERPIGNIDIRQEIRLAPTFNDILFCLGIPETIADSHNNPSGEYNDITGVSTRGEQRNSGGVLDYDAFSMVPRVHQLNYKTTANSTVREMYRRIGYLELNTKIPTSLKRLTELTREIIEREVERHEKKPLTRTETVSILESYLRDSGKYQYSLDLSISDPKIDPVEDFLFNKMKGDCEYFATALALMIRSAGIPARVVSGYKGGVPIAGKREGLEVQQRFAHLWVEAWVDTEMGGWTTFDATPAEARTQSIASITGKKSSLWTEMQSKLSGLWSENVLNMTLDRQETNIYKPMRELAKSLWKIAQQMLTSPKAATKTLWELLSNREQWFSVGGGIFAFLFLLFVAGSAWLVRWFVIQLRRWMADVVNPRHRPRRRVIEFYERFVRLMRERGLQRGQTQTQHEFAQQVASAFSPELREGDLQETPDQISRLFYQVRFGDQELSAGELDNMESMLTKLEYALSSDAKSKNGQAAFKSA
jgi:hypothetical protein